MVSYPTNHPAKKNEISKPPPREISRTPGDGTRSPGDLDERFCAMSYGTKQYLVNRTRSESSDALSRDEEEQQGSSRRLGVCRGNHFEQIYARHLGHSGTNPTPPTPVTPPKYHSHSLFARVPRPRPSFPTRVPSTPAVPLAKPAGSQSKALASRPRQRRQPLLSSST